MKLFVPNPCLPNGRKPVELITDRAKRYRAQQSIEQRDRRCIYCGSPDANAVEHINGKESDGTPANLGYGCRSCNTAKGILFAALGIGEKTRQFNPPAKPAANLFQYSLAVDSIRKRDSRTGRLMGWSGKSRAMPVAAAVAMIRATPPDKRSEFAKAIWAKRRQHGTASISRTPF